MDACNAMHEARAAGATELERELTSRLATLLQRYDETDGDNHPNPAWSRPNQRALAQSAMGRVDLAIETELTALKYADTPRRKEISLGNIADRLIRLERFDEAVIYFMKAWTVAPSSVPVMMTGAEALYGAGRPEEADAIFEALGEMPELMTEHSELVAYLDFSARLMDMAADLPALRRLFEARDEMRGGRHA
jgi:tetratricopeptide (TPR) repeat protein